jgi:adenine-specific DNA methylase
VADHPKRLIEVDLPIKRISGHARREKSIRHGHISTLHIWWARRPLAACRAVICAALWPDPADKKCPQEFRDKAAELITAFAQKVMGDKDLAESCSPQSFGRWNTLSKPGSRIDPTNPAHLNMLRYALLDFIADFANWDNSTVKEYLETSRALTQATHEALGGEPGTRPLVVDPFAGGGAIPLEALRVGADAFASDLNPVAVLLNKVVLEYIPKYGQRLADEVRKWGQWIKEQAEKELAEFYPKDPDGAVPIAYLWARTIKCEGPGCGAEVPLMRSLWLAKKGERSVALQLVPDAKKKLVEFRIIEKHHGKWVEQANPTSEVKNPQFDGTVKRGSATCPVCGYTTPVTRVREQLKERRGGAEDARLLCVVTIYDDRQGRFFRLPVPRDLEAARKATAELEQRQNSHRALFLLVPDERFPPTGLRRVQVPNYGIESVGDIFTPRQALAISTLVNLARSAREAWPNNDLSKALSACLSLLIDKQIDLGNSLNRWEPVAQCPRQLFARQSVPIVWDFAEGVPIGESSGSWHVLLKNTESTLISHSNQWHEGHVEMASALSHPLPDDSGTLLVTDPPYYDSVVYAHTADVFYPWLRRQLYDVFPELFQTYLSPKEEEIVVDPPHSESPSRKDARFFEGKMAEALADARRVTNPAGLAVIVFAHQSTAGWEAMLNAVIDAGWLIKASWPIDTEMATRVIAQGRSVLASSVHLVCRPRESLGGELDADSIGDWRDMLVELPKRIHEWMPRLAQEGVVGADAIFACLGPALEIFSRYSRVEKASGEVVTLREHLEQVWATVAREALSMVFEGADTTGFEEDARLTAIWFWVMKEAANGNGKTTSPGGLKEDEEESDQSEDEEEKSSPHTKAHGYTMEYDAVRKLAQGLGTDLQVLSRPGGIITIRGNLATLNGIASREQHLIGMQLSLFNGETPIHRGRAKKGQSGVVTMKLVNVRQTSLFAEQSKLQSDPDQPLLPPFRSLDDVRPLMERLLESGVTVLDRLHQAMLLFGRGQTALLGPFLLESHIGPNARFWQLAQALSALYPSGTDEKRWVDGVLARKKGLGF